MKRTFLLILTAFVLQVCSGATAKEEQRKCAMGRDYWVFSPDSIDKNKKYWLVVGVHGLGGSGKGAAGLGKWISKYDNVIVVGPSFPSKGPFYQGLGGETDKQLLDIKAALEKEFNLHSKMFIYGFSGGSQFSHRFASKHPGAVAGVSANSGGSWSNADPKAKAVLWTVSCGLKDTASSVPGSPPRIDCFRAFVTDLLKSGFCAEPFVTEAGHSPAKPVGEHTEECFLAATTGMFAYHREATKEMSAKDREEWIAKNLQTKETVFNDGKTEHKLMTNPDGWIVNAEALAAMRETRAMLDAENAKKK